MKKLVVLLACVCLWAGQVFAQTPTLIQGTTPPTSLVVVPITATAAINTATTLTIPAPAGGLYNYVCSLGYQVNQNATGTAITNAVSTSTNFNSFAVKFSQLATVNIDSGVQMVLNSLGPAAGCPKSAAPGVATTFVSPASLTNAAWTWYATYFQAP